MNKKQTKTSMSCEG